MQTFRIIALLVVFPFWGMKATNPVKGLDFRLGDDDLLPGWVMDYRSMLNFSCDSTIRRDDTYPLLIRGYKVNDKFLHLSGCIRQTCLLPPTTADSLEVSLTCKSLNLKAVRLIVSGLDRSERILYSDTLFADGMPDWYTYRKYVPLKETVAVNLALEMIGEIDSFEQKLWLDRLALAIDGKRIEDYAYPDAAGRLGLQAGDVIPLRTEQKESYASIPGWKDKKVLALGETVHGCETFGEIAMQIFRYRIEHQRCRLVLLEMPLEQMLYVNRYVQGDERFSLDSIRSYFEYSLLSRHFPEFFRWLKKYNANADEKVWLLGTDIHFDQMGSRIALCRYLEELNRSRQDTAVGRLCMRILSGSSRSDHPEKFTDLPEPVIREMLGAQEAEIFRYCLDSVLLLSSRTNVRLQMRDSMMYRNTTFLTGLLCPGPEVVTVYTHWGHANYLSPSAVSPLEPACGRFMKKTFGDRYGCVGLLASSGMFLTFRGTNVLTVRALTEPDVFCLETALGHVGSDFFYLPVTTLPAEPVLIRHIGNAYRADAFDPVMPGGRMDGIIYVRQCRALEVPPAILNRPIDTSARIMVDFKNIWTRLNQKDAGKKRCLEKHRSGKRCGFPVFPDAAGFIPDGWEINRCGKAGIGIVLFICRSVRRRSVAGRADRLPDAGPTENVNRSGAAVRLRFRSEYVRRDFMEEKFA